jgi:hypothetical protein
MENERSSRAIGSEQTIGSNAQTGSAREQGKQKAAEVAEEAKHKAGEVVEQAKHKAAELTTEAKTRAADEFDTRKSQAISRLDGVASALRQTSRELENQEDTTIAQYTDAAADQVERFSHYLDQRDFGQLVNEVKQLAHRQPEMFVAGALAAGFLVGRFFKSSRTPARDESYGGYGYEYGGYGYGGYASGPAYSGEYGNAGEYGRGYDRYASADYGYRREDRYQRDAERREIDPRGMGYLDDEYRDYDSQNTGSSIGQTGSGFSGSGAQGAGTSANATGWSQAQSAQGENAPGGRTQGQDSGRSNPQDQPGRQGSSGASVRDQGAQGQSGKE